MTEGPLSAGTLTVRIVSDAGNLGKDVERQVNGAAAGAVGAVDKAGKSVSQRARQVGGRASLFLTAPLLLGAKAAIDAGSDIVESTNKVNVVFGRAGRGVVAWSEGMAQGFGVSKREALDAAGTFGNLFRTIGLGPKAAAKTSTSMTELAGDLASFHNADPSEVLLALRSGLVGEVEPLRKFGVQLSEARVQAEAVALGLAKATKNTAAIAEARTKVELATSGLAKAERDHGKGSDEAKRAQLALAGAQRTLSKETKGSIGPLTDAQKLQARQSIIMRDSKLAQGDFQRSLSTSSANQERVNKALEDNAKAAIGQQLLPLYHKALITVGKVAGAFSHLSGGQQKLIVIFGASLAALGPVLTVAGNVGRAYRGLAKPTGALIRGGAGLVGGFRNVDKAMGDNASMATRVGAGIRSQLGLWAQQAKALASTVAARARETAASAAQTAAQVRQRVVTIASTVAQRAQALGAKLAAGAQWLLNAAMSANPIVLVVAALAALAIGLVVAYRKSETFRKIVQAVFGWIKQHWPLLLAIITGPIGLAVLFIVRHFDAIRDKVRAVIGWVREHWKLLLAILTGPFGLAIAWVAGHFGQVADLVRGVVDRVVGFFTHLPGRILGALGDMKDLLFDIGKDILNGLWNGLKSKWNTVKGWVGGIGGAIKHLKGPKEKDRKLLVEEGRAIMEGLGSGLVGGFADVQAYVRGLAAKIRDKISDPGVRDDLLRLVKDNKDALLDLARTGDQLGKQLDKARDKLKSVREEARGFASTVREGITSTGSLTGIDLSDPTTGEPLGAKAGAKAIVAGLRGARDRARRFRRQLRSLERRGLGKRALRTLYSEGVDTAGATVNALAHGTDAQVRQVRRLQGQLGQAADATAAHARKLFYASGIAAADGVVKGLEDREDKLRHTMRRLARSMVDEIRKELGIHSASRVLAGVGGDSGRGLVVGALAQERHVRAAGVRLASALAQPISARSVAYRAAPAGLVARGGDGEAADGRRLLAPVHVHPAPGMDEETIGKVAAHELEWQLR